MDLGLQLALDVLGIYALFGPFVFLGFYVFFDRLAEKEPDMFRKKNTGPVHPDLWTGREIDDYLNEKAYFHEVTDPPH